MVKLQNSENKKKTKKVVLLVGVIIIVIIGILLALKLTKNDSKEKSATEADAYEIVKPGKDTLDVSKIQGYSAKVGVEDKKEEDTKRKKMTLTKTMILRKLKKQSKSFFPIRTSRLSPSVLIPVLL